MKSISLPNKIEDALPALSELLRRSIDGTTFPLFIDYENQRVLIRSTTASAGTSVFEIALWGSITTGGVGTYLSTANFRSDVNVTGTLTGINQKFTNLTANNLSATASDIQGTFRAESTANFNSALNVTGTTNSSGTSNWTNITAGGLTITSTANFFSAVNVTGNQINQGWVRINLALGSGTSTAAGEPQQANTLYADNIIKGWISFDGSTTTPTVKDSFNVSSITDNGTGDYTINWATAFANSGYSVVSMCSNAGYVSQDGSVPTTTATRLTPRDAAGTQIDTARNFVISVGDQ